MSGLQWSAPEQAPAAADACKPHDRPAKAELGEAPIQPPEGMQLKVQITSGCQGGAPMRHLDADEKLDLEVAHVAPLYLAGRVRLLDEAADRPVLMAFLKKQDAGVRRQIGDRPFK